MMKPRVLKATAAEKKLIEELTRVSVFDRLDAGEVEIVDADDWSGVPQVEHTATLTIPAPLYRRLREASRKRRTTPNRLARQLLERQLPPGKQS